MCFSLCLSLTHTYIHTQPWVKKIWLLKERDYNNSFSKERWMKSELLRRVQACTKLAKICSNTNKWNTIQLQTNNTLLRLVLKAPASILERNIKHSCFVQLTEFSGLIIVLFKQNKALKIAGFRWEEWHKFYCSSKRNLLCVGKREQLSWKAKRNCRIAQGWQTLQTVIADMEY